MTRDEAMAVVKKHIVAAIEGASADTLDTARSMRDMGANSLDIVEIVSASMRELKVKIPRSELSKIKNVDGLVDLLVETASKSAG